MSDPGGMTCLSWIYVVSRQVEGDLGGLGRRLASRKQGACQICSSPAFPEHSMLYLPPLPWGGLWGPPPPPLLGNIHTAHQSPPSFHPQQGHSLIIRTISMSSVLSLRGGRRRGGPFGEWSLWDGSRSKWGWARYGSFVSFLRNGENHVENCLPGPNYFM